MSKASNLAGFVPSIGPTNNLNVGIVTATGIYVNGQELPRGVGIATEGGYVGSAATVIDFRGAGISTVTVSSGIATVNVTGGGSGGGLTVLGTPHTSTTYTFQSSEVNSISGTITDQLRVYVLPIGSSLQVGDQFQIFDVGDSASSSGNAAIYPITISPNAADRIQGASAGSSYILSENGGSVRFVWMGSTYQWRVLK